MLLAQLIENAEKRDTDFSNFEGWESSLVEVWPEAELKRRGALYMALVNSVEVGNWDTVKNVGYVRLSDVSPKDLQ